MCSYACMGGLPICSITTEKLGVPKFFGQIGILFELIIPKIARQCGNNMPDPTGCPLLLTSTSPQAPKLRRFTPWMGEKQKPGDGIEFVVDQHAPLIKDVDVSVIAFDLRYVYEGISWRSKCNIP